MTDTCSPNTSTNQNEGIMIDVTIIGEHDANTVAQMHTVAAHPAVRSAVLMPDGHLGYAIPIGGVVAYQDAISPSGVGFDIGCGVLAVNTGLRWADVAGDAATIADQIQRDIAFGIGRKNPDPTDAPVLHDARWDDLPSTLRGLKQMAANQLGTVGSGNHYVDILEAENGDALVATHFGSRGLGHKTATFFLAACGAKDGMMVEAAVIDQHDAPALFDGYVNAMELAGEYAFEGRRLVVDQVLLILGAGTPTEVVHNHHNYAWQEHGMWVVRKGATPANPGPAGFVGGSMNDVAVVVTGTDQAAQTLWSTVHGAGRVMSRTAAAGKIRKVDGRRVRVGGAITDARFAESTAGVTLRGGGLDEAPDVYRPLADVLAHLGDTVEVTRTMHPWIVVMASPHERDPYND
jgi:tRNA-splicing ligase RtcB (3'-phosphate/5'-hydroxy nucleic acid ligase)